MYANNGGLDKAVNDFEAALKNNPNHKNGKKYLCETLIAVARNHEDDNKVFDYRKFRILKSSNKKYITDHFY